jgi:hypothetical protein
VYQRGRLCHPSELWKLSATGLSISAQENPSKGKSDISNIGHFAGDYGGKDLYSFGDEGFPSDRLYQCLE